MSNAVIAGTILNQLGGNRFVAMTGAKNFVAGDRALNFRLPRAKDGINLVRIVLNGMDTYDVSFLSVRGAKFSSKREDKGIYADMLQSIFTEATGLYTSL